jgi:tRNA(fMet)-specific endonuclease VapC
MIFSAPKGFGLYFWYRSKGGRSRSAGGEMLVSAVTAYELWYGVAKSAEPEAHAPLVESFFADPVALLPFEEEDARTAGPIRATLQSTGERIGAYDVLIAGQRSGTN